ncbi:MAG TPA: hypothetical protein VJ111_10555 [Chitinophagaceae bacterium]|nr:hypothetical protein [Chitinophagaceae bacterium]
MKIEHWTFSYYPILPLHKKAIRRGEWLLTFKSADYFLEKPGYAIITEGVHDLSVDCMNTSFFFGEQ